MSVLSISSQDNRLFSAEIASQLGDINAAVIIQQLHYWMGKEGVGTIREQSEKVGWLYGDRKNQRRL